MADKSQSILDSIRDARKALGINDSSATSGGGDGGGDSGETNSHPHDTTNSHPRDTGNDAAANSINNNNYHRSKTKASGSDYTDRSRPCVRGWCRVRGPHNNGAVADCRYWCHDPNCVQARTKHMRLYEDNVTPGQTPCKTLSEPRA